MKKPRLTKEEINKIISFRRKGYSLSEIKRLIPRGKSTLHKYTLGVVLSKKYKKILENKQNGSRSKIESQKEWSLAERAISNKIGNITKRDLVLIAGMLYWGEGNKKSELNLINSDSALIRVFLKGLKVLGVSKNRVKISLRLYPDLNEDKSVKYWLNELGLDNSNLVSVSYLEGKKSGKLPFGMCRLRVQRGGLYFKQLISIIDLIKKPL